MARSRHRLAFEAYGVCAAVSCDDGELFELLPPHLPPGWARSEHEAAAEFAVGRDGLIAQDGKRVAGVDARDREELAVRVGAVVRRHVALHAPDRIFVHAGVVGVDGSAIVLPGRSHTGKSTLVAALLAQGATYYSDEYAVVDSLARIEPYAKPLSIRGPGAEGPGRPVPVPASQTASEPVRARLVAITRYFEGASWRPKPLAGGEAALVLLKNTLAARERPQDALDAVTGLARGATLLHGKRGEAGETARMLLESLAAASVPPSG